MIGMISNALVSRLITDLIELTNQKYGFDSIRWLTSTWSHFTRHETLRQDDDAAVSN
jgi:hypothetical protein